MNETRTFQISTNMIFHTIESQAGSIEKALLECLMNAVDAGATEVKINLSSDGLGYEIIDNGKGFKTKEEIYNCFEVFGFDHGTTEQNKRTYGTFGIGRAQLWAFSKNVWKTNEFELIVDIKNKGLDYNLTQVKKKVKGCHIVGEFYEKQSVLDVQNIKRELMKLAQYLPISFYLDGLVVNKDSSKMTWTENTPEAYIKLNQTGDLLIYNKGVFVCAYNNWKFGTGGTIVSKEAFALNTARNDILTAKCEVWKKIKKFVEDKTTRSNLKKDKLTTDQMNNFVYRFIYGELSFSEIHNNKIFIDIQGKPQTLNFILRNFKQVVIADKRASSAGENLLRAKLAFVFSPQILEFLDISAEEFIRLINIQVPNYYNSMNLCSFSELTKNFSKSYAINNPKDYTKKQKIAIRILTRISQRLHYYMKMKKIVTGDVRKILIGKADESVQAWTDGSSYIAFNETTFKHNLSDARGIHKLIHILIHEYCHDSISSEDHIHSFNFFENYHDFTIEASFQINDLIKEALNLLLKHHQEEGTLISKKMARSIDAVIGSE